MATVISRASWYTPLVDDSGSGTNGTVIVKAFFGAFADSIDAFFTGAGFAFGTNFVFSRDTADGSDNGTLYFTGGGAYDGVGSRGATFTVSGNEQAATGNVGPGIIGMQIGNVSGSKFYILGGAAGTQYFAILGADGSCTFTSSARPNVTFNSTEASGSSILVQRSGVTRGRFTVGVTAADDFGIVATSALVLQAGTNIQSPTITATTTATAANMVIESDIIKRSTSSARYKTNIRPMSDGDWTWLLDLQPVTFNPKELPNGRSYGGLLAEDVAANGPHANGLPLYAGLDVGGQPDDVAYGHLTAPIICAIQALTKRLAALERHR